MQVNIVVPYVMDSCPGYSYIKILFLHISIFYLLYVLVQTVRLSYELKLIISLHFSFMSGKKESQDVAMLCFILCLWVCRDILKAVQYSLHRWELYNTVGYLHYEPLQAVKERIGEHPRTKSNSTSEEMLRQAIWITNIGCWYACSLNRGLLSRNVNSGFTGVWHETQSGPCSQCFFYEKQSWEEAKGTPIKLMASESLSDVLWSMNLKGACMETCLEDPQVWGHRVGKVTHPHGISPCTMIAL